MTTSSSSENDGRSKSRLKPIGEGAGSRTSYTIQQWNRNPMLQELQRYWDEAHIGVSEIARLAKLPRSNIHNIFIAADNGDVMTSTYLKIFRALRIRSRRWSARSIADFTASSSESKPVTKSYKDPELSRYSIQQWNANPMLLEIQKAWHDEDMGVTELARSSSLPRGTIHSMFITAQNTDVYTSTYLKLFRALNMRSQRWSVKEIDDYLSGETGAD